MEIVPFLNQRISYKRLPDDVMEAVQLVTMFDTQYTLQVEEADENSEIYRMRFERNIEAARIGLALFAGQPPGCGDRAQWHHPGAGHHLPGGRLSEDSRRSPMNLATSASGSGWPRMPRSCARKRMACGKSAAPAP